MRQLDVLRPDEVHVLEGRGYAAAWEAPFDDLRNTVFAMLGIAVGLRDARACDGKAAHYG